MSHPVVTVVAYAFVADGGLFAVGLVGGVRWADSADTSAVVLSAGAAALAVITLAVTLIGQIQHV